MSSDQQRDRQIAQNQLSIQSLIDSAKNANELPKLDIPIQDNDVFIVRANGVTYHITKSDLFGSIKGEATLLSFFENILSVGVDNQETPLSVDLSSLDQTEEILDLEEELKEIKETPSGLVLFDLKGSELWLSVDGIMPTKVDLSPIATKLKTIKLTITPAQMRAAALNIDDGSGSVPNPNIIPIVIVPDPTLPSTIPFSEWHAILATSIQARTVIGTNTGYDGIKGFFVKSSIPSPFDLSYYPQCFLKTVLDGANGDSQVGDTILESAKGFDEESFGYTQLDPGAGLVLVFNDFYDQYVDGDIDLSVTYKEVTF
tara:strand:+ start:6872 stop:7816 length:945 start_codon:yes stop_codon:yes gene_type:complete